GGRRGKAAAHFPTTGGGRPGWTAARGGTGGPAGPRAPPGGGPPRAPSAAGGPPGAGPPARGPPRPAPGGGTWINVSPLNPRVDGSVSCAGSSSLRTNLSGRSQLVSNA